MKCPTLIREVDLPFNNEIYMLWHLILCEYYRFVSTDIDRIDILSPWLCSMQYFEPHIDHDVSSEFHLSATEGSIKEQIEVIEKAIEQSLLQSWL